MNWHLAARNFHAEFEFYNMKVCREVDDRLTFIIYEQFTYFVESLLYKYPEPVLLQLKTDFFLFFFQFFLLLEVLWPVIIFVAIALVRRGVPPSPKSSCKSSQRI